MLSIRSSYEELLTPKELIPHDVAIKIRHAGFEGVEYQAATIFFSQYDIEQPSIPLLHPEFSSPLFLRLFCDGLHRSGQKRIPKGYGGITSIIDFFLSSVDDKLSHPSFFDYQPASSKKLVKKVINALIQDKLQNNLSSIPYESAVDIANNIVSKFSNKKNFIDALISEGVLSKNLSREEEIIYFAYERFEDHFTADYLLEKYLDKNHPEGAFQGDGVLARYVHQAYQYQGIVEAWSIQLPEKIDKELYELVSNEKKSDLPIIEAFIKSLIWRKPNTIKEKVIAYVNQQVLRYEHTFDLFFQMVYSVSSDPEHFFNANYLHCYLMPFSLADRDAFWTTYLHDKNDDGSAMQRLIDWAYQDGNKNYLSTESRLLAGKALAWLLTSTNIGLRDSATKALVCVLENNIPVITQLLTDFDNVNDPYVYERVLAAAYGAVLRSGHFNGLAELSDFILKSIFLEKEEVYPNVLVRDYARNIIEYALYQQVFTLDNPQIIRPPYKSRFPDSFPSNAEIDANRRDSFSNSKYWGQDAILRSMVTEYGRGTGCYGDFGRYTFQSALHDWEYKFNPNDLSNYACQLIFEKYSYDIEKHGEFDIDVSKDDFRTHKKEKERIGKKYQWIAFYEVLARVADNYQMKDTSTGWGENQKYTWYQGTWELFIRNIDPTLIYRSKDNPPFNSNESWWNKVVEYNDWHDKDWLISSENLPNPKEIIELKDTQGNEWLVLETYPTWDEPIPVGYEQYEHPHKQLWYQIRSYFVQEEQSDSLITWAKQQHFMGKWFPESSVRYQVFSREYYWSPAHHFFDNLYYSHDQWEDVHEKDGSKQIRNEFSDKLPEIAIGTDVEGKLYVHFYPTSRLSQEDGYEKDENEQIDNPVDNEVITETVGKVIATAERYIWESGSDYREQSSYLAPRQYMYEKMQLQYSKNIGEWLNAQDEVVCFDPSVYQKGCFLLLIRKDVLFKFLKENNLKIFWTCLGEKQISGDLSKENEETTRLELSGVFTLDKKGVDGVMTPFIK